MTPDGGNQRTLDGRLTSLFSAAMVLALGFGVIVSLWIQASGATAGAVIIYAGFVAACVLAVVGVRRAARRGTARAMWPMIGTAIVIASLVVGILIADSA